MEKTTYRTPVNVPQIKDHALLVRLWHEQVEISVSDIMAIFGVSASTAYKLKCRAREEMILKGVPSWNPHMVNTVCAYRSWGIDPAAVERIEKTVRKRLVFGAEGGNNTT